MRILSVLTVFALLLSTGEARAGASDLRIARPAMITASDSTAKCAVRSSADFCTTSGAIPLCSKDGALELRPVENYKCCDVTSKYFPLRIMGPSQHFGMWLKLNLFPTLCSSVLCQRQCALNGYESCSALGLERNLIQEVMEGAGDCSSADASCCAGENHQTQQTRQTGSRRVTSAQAK